ncbi:hypothetical protein GVAV_001722 [Gurleya vavrai]
MPESIKTYLFTAASKSNHWSEFVKQAEEISWVAFKEHDEILIGQVTKKTWKYKIACTHPKRKDIAEIKNSVRFMAMDFTILENV